MKNTWTEIGKFVLVTLGGALLTDLSAESLRVSGSTTVNPVVSEAAERLRERKGMRILIDTTGGSSGGINALGDGRADLAMSSRTLNERDRKKFPSVDFHPIHIGEDAISMVVSADVWNSGIHALSATQMRGIYEGVHTHWDELGGMERRIVFFDKEPGRGTWEVFIKWLYGGPEHAPRVSNPHVGANAEVRSKVAGTRGAISYVSTPWAESPGLFALDIMREAGGIVRPDKESIASHTYPLSRPLYVITDGEPQGMAATLIEYLLSEEGQSLVAKHGYLKLSDLQ